MDNPQFYKRCAQEFGLALVDYRPFPRTIEGFQTWLDMVGIKNTTAKELTTPHQKATALQFGYTEFLPTQSWWYRAIPLCGIFMQLRNLIDRPIPIPNWWRPGSLLGGYNKAVGGKKGSTHLTARGFDLTIINRKNRKRCIEFLVELDVVAPWLKLGIGKNYNSRIHIDCGVKRRSW